MADIPEDRMCLHCGQVIPHHAANCPSRESREAWRSPQRETVLLLSLVVLGLLFTVTGFATRRYHAREEVLAQTWYSQGEADLKGGRPAKAVDDFQTALLYSQTNAFYRLRLAQALLAANRIEEARAHLMNLWEEEPENGVVNLELGRLAMREGKISAVLRYYHNAIYGIWTDDLENTRRVARWELCRFLLDHGDRADAEAELMALAADLPEDAALHAEAGDWFLEIKDYNRALAQFHQALRLEPSLPSALAGAGEASFGLAHYEEAKRYLERAVREKREDSHSAQLLEMTNLVLGIDPYQHQLSTSERSRRVMRAFQQAIERLEACAQSRGELLKTPQPQTPLESVYIRIQKLRPKVREQTLRRDPDLITAAMDLVVEAETDAAASCGPAQGLDRAILLAAQRHGGA